MAEVNSEVVAEPVRFFFSEQIMQELTSMRTIHVSGPDFSFVDNIEGCGGDVVCNRIEPNRGELIER